ncbi:hypothetical protein D043_0727A, partial [Vibrio parahaemolyticus EKP-021]
MKLPNGFSF